MLIIMRLWSLSEGLLQSLSGQQKSDKSVPVVIASDQSTIPVAEQNKVQSEVALSLLGIPRSEVALGIFADVNTYDVNPTEWAAEPDQFSEVPVGTSTPYTGVTQSMNWGLTHVPEESGALVEAPADKTAILTSKDFLDIKQAVFLLHLV